MKTNGLKALPICALATIALAACNGLTDEEKKYIGEWSSDNFDTIIIDGGKILSSNHFETTYYEDKTYRQIGNEFIKYEISSKVADFRIYYYLQEMYTGEWSAKNGIFTDSTVSVQCTENMVAPNNTIAIRWNDTGEKERFGINNFPQYMDSEIKEALKEMYIEIKNNLVDSAEIYEKGSKEIYKIKYLGENEIVSEDNDGKIYTERRGDVLSQQAKEMQEEAEALMSPDQKAILKRNKLKFELDPALSKIGRRN